MGDVIENAIDSVVQKNVLINKSDTLNSASDKNTTCKECGEIIYIDEKYCIRCGKAVENEVVYSENVNEENEKYSKLQLEIVSLSRSNKLLAFIAKYVIVFALYHPIYLLMTKIPALEAVTDLMQHFYPIGFYSYYIALILLFSNKNYFLILIAVTMRLINSIVYMFQGYSVISSLCSIAIYVLFLVVLYRLLSNTRKFIQIKKKLNIETRNCSVCGSSVKQNDIYCSKCGNKM